MNTSNNSSISWYKFDYWGNEKKYVNEALESSWISGGSFIELFENKLKEQLNFKNVLAVSNGTSALQLAFLGINLKPEDEVIIPAFGFMAAANILTSMKATPIFVDIDKSNWCLDISLIEQNLSSKTKAIVVIHNYGVVANMNEVQVLCQKNGIILIEDCAESIYSKYQDQYCGNFGDISTFSFHATKTIATGEGGAVVCKNESLYDKLKLIRSHGLRREKKHYYHEDFGNNFRMSNLIAALGVGQLEMSELILTNKRRVYNEYKKNLADFSGLEFQAYPPDSDPIIWAIALFIDPNTLPFVNRDLLIDILKQEGIECRPGFYTPNQLEIYSKHKLNQSPVANEVARQLIVLPSYPTLSNEDIKYICVQLKSCITQLSNDFRN
ncbi:MAG: DegT/DnrJ/EryC1/StrS family aminotransferase [Rickettsiaceae bacterium]|nr:DegT/DnrJ/EryC1/StrS family aminotransferase [Rickettsiaceae bacterium]